MATRTLLQLRAEVRQRANMENSLFVTDSELDRYINLSLSELYDILVSKYGQDYFMTSYDFSTTAGVDSYALPTDLYKLAGVDMKLDPVRFIRLKRFEFAERNRVDYAMTLREIDLKYRLRGEYILFSPIGNMSGRQIRLWYIPKPTLLVNTTDTVEGYNGWEEHAIITAAIKCLGKEESDTSTLQVELAKITTRIESMAAARDTQSPMRVYDNETVWEYQGIWP
jgi:hypothetical protein